MESFLVLSVEVTCAWKTSGYLGTPSSVSLVLPSLITVEEIETYEG